MIADRLAVFTGDVFGQPATASGSVLFLAAVCFTLQVYLDFSGYTDIAIGIARLMGVRLAENFAWPFLARNPSDFWNRWHMTLTGWFRDYVGRPLGRKSLQRPVASMAGTVLVLGLVGLWHGAAWNFVAFGLVAGVVLAVTSWLRALRKRNGRGPLLGDRWWSTPLAILLTDLHVVLLMILFGARDLPAALDMIAGIFTRAWTWSGELGAPFALALLVALFHFARGRYFRQRGLVPLSPPLRGLFWAGMTLLIVYGIPEATQPFIYFRF